MISFYQFVVIVTPLGRLCLLHFRNDMDLGKLCDRNWDQFTQRLKREGGDKEHNVSLKIFGLPF